MRKAVGNLKPLLLLLTCSAACAPVSEFEYRGQMRDCSIGATPETTVYSVLFLPAAGPERGIFGVGSFTGQDTWITTEVDEKRTDAGLQLIGEFVLTASAHEPFVVELERVFDGPGFEGTGRFDLGDDVEVCDTIELLQE